MPEVKMATPWKLLLLSFFIIISPQLALTLTFKTHLNRGSSLSVENPDQVLASPNEIFIAGFYLVGDNAYCFAIWFNDPSCPQNCTVVWMANRDTPVNGRLSKLSLLKTGNLVLTDAGHSTIWSTNTDSTLHSLTLLDTGNLVLGNESGLILWQSFDSPTDTILPLQEFNRYSMLVSWRSRSNFSSGFYKLSFDEQNVLVLFYDSPLTSSAFWPVDHSQLPRDFGRTTYNSSRIAILDELGNFDSSDNFSFSASDSGVDIQRRLTLDYDGNLRLYSRESGSGSKWIISWQAILDSCQIHGSCGPNSVCSYVQTHGIKTCSCLPGFSRKNETDWSLGCEPKFNVTCVDGQIGVDDMNYIPFVHVESKGYDIDFLVNYTLEMCMDYCSKRCDCKGFQFKWFYRNSPNNIPYCFPKTQLLNGFRIPNFRGTLYLKVPKSNSNVSSTFEIQENMIACPTQIPNQQQHRKYGNSKEVWSLNFLIWFVIAVGSLESIGMLCLWVFVVVKIQQSKVANQGFMLAETGFKRFAYKELIKATRNFKEEIGRGASGVVYKGTLSNDRVVAVKRLHQSEHGEAEFLAEASAIGKLNHMHLIEMLGYCAERKHRLLVYEYMEHGSLAQNLSSTSLDWKQRFQIAVGTAKGLAYLHEECLEWILHCDLKPENILLDTDYQPKVSDFGLSKLLDRGDLESSNFSRIRGTRGYMAPEWVYRLPITAKVDVYSYGVVVLEMLTGKNPSGVRTVEREGVADEIRLVNWVRDQRSTEANKGAWVGGILDPMIESNCDMDKVELLVEVALQCVEEDMNARPSMSQVVQMLQSPKLWDM